MTRRSATTVSIQIKLRRPSRMGDKALLEWITSALLEHNAREKLKDLKFWIDLNEMQLRVTERKTVYL